MKHEIKFQKKNLIQKIFHTFCLLEKLLPIHLAAWGHFFWTNLSLSIQVPYTLFRFLWQALFDPLFLIILEVAFSISLSLFSYLAFLPRKNANLYDFHLCPLVQHSSLHTSHSYPSILARLTLTHTIKPFFYFWVVD